MHLGKTFSAYCFCSALSIKLRTGTLTRESRADVAANWRQFRDANLGEIAIAPDHFETTARFCDHYALGVRAGDALHLAIAESANAALLTFDRTMADAALQLGIQVEPL